MTTVETTELGDSVKPPGSSFKPLSGRRKVVNSTAEVAVVVAVVIALIPLVWLLVTLVAKGIGPVSYTHLRAHATVLDLVCRLLLDKKHNSPLRTLMPSTTVLSHTTSSQQSRH